MAAQPFHAGGAVPAFRLAEPSMQGLLGVITTYWPSLSHVDITRLGSLIAIAGVLPAAWRLLHGAWSEAYSWIRQFFVASVTIPGRDPLNKSVVNWVLTHVVQPRNNTRFFTARTEVRDRLGRQGDAPDSASLKKTQRRVQYLPHFETIWFWKDGQVFIVHRSLESFNASMCDPGYDGIGGEDLSISCLGRSAEPIRSLLQTCRDFADQQTQYYVMIYSRDRYGISWQPKSRKPIRLLETVHFDEDVKQGLLCDIRKYLDPETQRRYRSRSMPYRRGYLFYGPPGTGKSSLSTALAGEFGLDLYEVKIPSVASDADLEQMFQEVPPQCIVLLEDIDAVWAGDRDLPADTTASISREDRTIGGGLSSGSHSPRSNCTLSGLLNVLDGVGSQEGRIVIMTTNKPELLDPALVRPGRVDLKVHLGNISRRSAMEMFMRMFASDLSGSASVPDMMGVEALQTLAAEFARQIPEGELTPSQLQGFFQVHLDSPVEAVSGISTWVARELSKNVIEDDIEIVGRGKA
jgi:mitochondrial chaperone BCS1